jgi:hypothetical protein
VKNNPDIIFKRGSHSRTGGQARWVFGTIWLSDLGGGVWEHTGALFSLLFLCLFFFPPSQLVLCSFLIVLAGYHIFTHMSAVFVFAIISVRHAEVIIALAGVLYFLFFLLHWIGNEDCWA